MHVNELGTFIGEADAEPNFAFLPFHSACYSKLLVSLVKMVHLLHFCSHSIGFLEQESQKFDKASWKEDVQKLDCDIKLVEEMVCSSIKCFNDAITMIKSLAILEKELEKKFFNIFHDIECGNSTSVPNGILDSDKNTKKIIINTYLQHLQELFDKVKKVDEEEFKNHIVLSLSTLGYCMQSLIIKTRQIQEGIKELLQWKNPSSYINLREIIIKNINIYFD